MRPGFRKKMTHFFKNKKESHTGEKQIKKG
jgi:hypothetical protein